MKILFLGFADWAAICRRISSAVNALVGEKVARVVTVREHPFGYEPPDWCVETGNLEGLEEFSKEVEWIISTGDGLLEVFTESLVRLPFRKDVKVGVTHAGTAYRSKPDFYNEYDKEVGARVRFVGADSYYLMRGDPRAVPYFGPTEIMVDLILPFTRPTLRVAHSPSSRIKKGTDTILPVLMRMQAAGYFEVDLIEGIPWRKALERRREAQIFVDQMVPTVGGWGMSAIEALGAGCATLADLRNVVPEVYGFFPKPPIEDVRDERDLRDWLKLWCERRDLLVKRREESLTWARAHASPEAVARYFLGHLERLAKN